MLQDPALPTRGQAPVSPTRKPTQAPGPTSPTREPTPETRGTAILQPVERRPQTQKVRLNEMTEKYIANEGTR